MKPITLLVTLSIISSNLLATNAHKKLIRKKNPITTEAKNLSDFDSTTVYSTNMRVLTNQIGLKNANGDQNRNATRCFLCDVFDDVLDAGKGIFTGGLWKDNWGYYDENNHNSVGPYTVFSKSIDIYEQQLKPIRKAILEPDADSVYYKLYQKIYANATSNDIQYTGSFNIFPVAKTAKSSAFVYLVGIKLTRTNGADTAYQMSATDTARIAFREKAISIIINMDVPGMGPGNLFDGLSNLPLVGSVAQYSHLVDGLGGASYFEKLVYRAKELQMFLSAFDMIKWASSALQSPCTF